MKITNSQSSRCLVSEYRIFNLSCMNFIISRISSIEYSPDSSIFRYLSIWHWIKIRYPPITFLNLIVSSLRFVGTTLSIFFINTTSASRSLRFSINAPCPAGLKSSSPFSRYGIFSISTAIVSVDGFCSERDRLYLTPHSFSYSSNFLAIRASKWARCSGETVKCIFTLPFLSLAYWAPSSRCSSSGEWHLVPILWNLSKPFGSAP